MRRWQLGVLRGFGLIRRSCVDSLSNVCRNEPPKSSGISGINLGRDGVYAIAIAIKYAKQIGCVRSRARGDTPKCIGGYEKRGLHRAIIPPKADSFAGGVVIAAARACWIDVATEATSSHLC